MERLLFLLSDHRCDMENIYLYLQRCFWVFFFGVFRLFHGYFKGTSRLFQENFNVILEYVNDVPRVLLGCFCPIQFALVAALTSVRKNKIIFDKIIQKDP